MIGRKDLRAELVGLLRLRAATAAEKALSGIPFDDELKEIEQVDKLLHFTLQSKKRTIYSAVLVGITCLIAACLLWTVRVPKAHMQLMVTSESVAMTLSQELNWSGVWDLSDGLLRLEEMSRIELPPEIGRLEFALGSRLGRNQERRRHIEASRSQAGCAIISGQGRPKHAQYQLPKRSNPW